MPRRNGAEPGLSFSMLSGGRLSVDAAACARCASKACVRRCVSSTLDPVLVIRDGRPVLSRPDGRPESGWCIECLACELDCRLHGEAGLKIEWPDDTEETDGDPG